MSGVCVVVVEYVVMSGVCSACNSVLFKGLRSLKGPLLILGHKNGLFLVKKVLFSPFFLLFFF